MPDPGSRAGACRAACGRGDRDRRYAPSRLPDPDHDRARSSRAPSRHARPVHHRSRERHGGGEIPDLPRRSGGQIRARSHDVLWQIPLRPRRRRHGALHACPDPGPDASEGRLIILPEGKGGGGAGGAIKKAVPGLRAPEPRVSDSSGLRGELTRTSRVAQRSCVLMLVKVLFSLVPSALTLTMMTTEMPAAMSPYSIAVAPDSSFRKRRIRLFMTSLFCHSSRRMPG